MMEKFLIIRKKRRRNKDDCKFLMNVNLRRRAWAHHVSIIQRERTHYEKENVFDA